MRDRRELPPDVLEAVKAGRTIQAIKLLREEWDLGLKEAKDIVDAEMRKHPRSTQPGMTTHGVGAGGVVLALIVAALAVAAYRFLVG